MRMHRESSVDATILDAAAILAIAMGGRTPRAAGSPGLTPARITTAAPVGAWLSSDGAVRLDLHTDGTYAGQVAGRKRRARGTYLFDGATLTLSDDSGLNTPVAVRDGELEMAGHRLEPALSRPPAAG
jgi:putative ligand-binding protein with streptavidin-like fold